MSKNNQEEQDLVGIVVGGVDTFSLTSLHFCIGKCLFWKADPRVVKIKSFGHNEVPQLSAAGRASCWKMHPRRRLLHPAEVR